MIINFDSFNRYEVPTMTLCNPNNHQIGILENIKNLNISCKFQTTSEISFEIYKDYEDENHNKVKTPFYEQIQTFKYILVDGLGYFVITDAPEEISNEFGGKKNIIATSCEFELNNVQISYLKGTYQCYKKDNPTDSMLGKLLTNIPRWTIGYVDETVANLSRTFNVPTDTTYGFLISEFKESYGCLIDFNILNRTINIYNKDNYVHKTNIILDKNEVINNINIQPKDSEIVTSLCVTGGNNLGIQDVNPLGTSNIYNFKSYKNEHWMSKSLIDAITAWEKRVDSKEIEYKTIINNIKTTNKELVVKDSEMANLVNAVKIKETEKTAIISNNDLTADQKNSALEACSSSIQILNNKINKLSIEIDTLDCSFNNLMKDKKDINEQLCLNSNFNQEQFFELSSFIREGEYREENIIQTDNMTYEEKINQSLELYTQSKKILDKLCEMRYEFSVNTNSFIFNSKFKAYQADLVLSNIIYLEFEDNDVRPHILLGMDFNFEELSTSFVFGNRYSLFNSKNLFDDLSNSVNKSSATISYERDNWNYAVVENKLDKAYEFSQSSLNLSKNEILSADGQSIQINNNGYIGRKIMPDKTIAPEELRLSNNQMIFYDNKLNIANTAVGYLVLPSPDGKTIQKYGVNTDMLIGKIVITNELQISNKSGTFSVDENGVNIQGYTQDSKLEKYLRYNPSEGIISIGNNIPDKDGYIFKVELDNKEISFNDNNNKVAYINNNKLNITEVEVTDKINIGKKTNGVFTFIAQDNGNLSIKWQEKDVIK